MTLTQFFKKKFFRLASEGILGIVWSTYVSMRWKCEFFCSNQSFKLKSYQAENSYCLWISRISFHLGDAPLFQSKLWSFIFFSTNQYITFIFLAELIVSSCYELSNNIGQKEELTKIKSPAMPMPISILKRNLGKINTPWIFKYCRKNVQPYLLWMNFHIIVENA